MQINVTQEDIDEARRLLKTDKRKSILCHCAVARAIKREISPDVYVDGVTASILINDKWVDFELPQVAQDFIELFDDNQPVDPITFDITI
jgi:hypothetical protein